MGGGLPAGAWVFFAGSVAWFTTLMVLVVLILAEGRRSRRERRDRR